MSWRRKALTLSLVLVVGGVGLGPVLSDSISKRIATSWNARASVSKVEVSLPRSSLSLFGLDIRRPDLSVYGEEVHLKMNYQSLLYRDSVVESMIGKGFLFRAQKSLDTTLATEPSNSSPMANAKRTIAALESNCKTFEAKVQAELELALKQFREFELQSQLRTQTIEDRISRFRSDLSALQEPLPTHNPLRVSQRVDQLRSEGSRIQQLLAEDRLHRKQEGRSYEATIASLQESIKKFRTTHPVPEIDTPLLIEEILHRSVKDAQRDLRPYTAMLQFSAGALLGHPSTESRIEYEPSSRIDQDLVTGSLKPRQSRILQGQISGITEYDGDREMTFIRIANPSKGAIADRARVQIEWRGKGRDGSGAEDAASQTNAILERANSDASSVATYLSVARQLNGERILFQSVWDTTTARSKLQFTSKLVEQQFSALGLAETPADILNSSDASIIEVSMSKAFLETTVSPDLFAIDLFDQEQGGWELRSEQVDALASCLEKQWSQSLSRLLEKTESRTKSIVSQENQSLQRLSQRVEEVMTQRQSEWNQQVQELIARVAEFEGQQLRARGNSSTITR